MAFDIAPYGAAIEATSNLLTGILKRVFPEKVSEETALKLNQEITMALYKGEMDQILSQLRINEKEAEHDSIFVAGWRPYIGWVCGNALAYTFLLQPFISHTIQVVAWLNAPPGTPYPPTPQLDMMSLMTLLFGMLGIGGMRSYEKIKGETTTATKVGA